MGAGDWKGKRFKEIVPPPDQIKRIIRLRETGFARETAPSGEQAAHDTFLAHLLDSTETATDWALGRNEGPMSELAVLSKDEVLCYIEIIGTAGSPTSPSAIIIHRKGTGARINVKDFKYPERKK